MDDNNFVTRCYEQTVHYQTASAKDVNYPIAVFNEPGNPLGSSKKLLTLNTKDILNVDAVKSILSAKQLGLTMQHGAILLTESSLTYVHLLHNKSKKDLKSLSKQQHSNCQDYISLVSQDKQI